ncbi:MAG: GNAT family N-acetyltransferase [Clostridia bacterium]|nr:GNAT family N-acetyltransferase [Clostridia bacterium]
MDMLVNLYTLPAPRERKDYRVCRVLPPDSFRVLDWVEAQFGAGWRSECSAALAQQPATCYIAQRQGQIIGFACYDATARGYFGPIGVSSALRGEGVGRELLLDCLAGMREAGYGYAVIGWCNEAAPFYEKTVHAVPIPESEPENTVYGRMARFSNTEKPTV